MKIINVRLKTCLCLAIIPTVVLALFFWSLTNKRAAQIVDNVLLVEEFPDVMQLVNQPKQHGLKPLKQPNWEMFEESMHPMAGVVHTRNRMGVRFVLGVPTVPRPGVSYLLGTLQQLVEKTNSQQRRDCLIVVYIGDTRTEVVQNVTQQLRDKFERYMTEGLIDILRVPQNYYPDFEALFVTLNDEPERAHWRTKQNLDLMYLMSYARSRGNYYLQLEDDLKINNNFLDYINKFTALQTEFRLAEHREWIILSFSELGFIGKLFRTVELYDYLEYLKLFYNDQPMDWLMQSYVMLHSCRWDSLCKQSCSHQYSNYLISAGQSQFQHVGLKSSLPAKVQTLKDRKFDKNSAMQRFNHLRQPQNLLSSLKQTLVSSGLSLREGETFIWGYMPQASSLLRYMEAHQFDYAQFKIRSGPQSKERFKELTVDVVEELPKFTANSTEAQRCGFLMSYTFEGKNQYPMKLFYYIKEQQEHADGNDSSVNWFRRFSWNGTAGLKSWDYCLQLWLLLLTLL
ncbi:CG17173 [Drosophila busckii]|uniref:CG17173 n=1 Tax=Drosophila busckii TaxID=30019 RepID=A0A0M4EQD1_DROBS|nr:CG17173 [Drosophila busckii]